MSRGASAKVVERASSIESQQEPLTIDLHVDALDVERTRGHPLVAAPPPERGVTAGLTQHRARVGVLPQLERHACLDGCHCTDRPEQWAGRAVLRGDLAALSSFEAHELVRGSFVLVGQLSHPASGAEMALARVHQRAGR